MRKHIAWLLAVILLFSFVGCGVDEQVIETNTAVPGESNNTTMEGENDTAGGEKPTDSEDALTEFQELTVVDNDECTIRITSISEDDIWGYTVKAYLENKSAEKTYMFSVLGASINGVKNDPFWASEVAPGKKANESITFMTAELEENGVTDVTDICMTFRVYDSNDFMADPVAEETVNVYPMGVEKATRFVRENAPEDQILVDNEFVTVIVTGYSNDSLWGYSANVFVVNKSDKAIMCSVDEVSVNGFMVDPFWAASLEPDTCSFETITWMSESLEENGITEVETIEFLLRVYQEEDWFAEDFAKEFITLNP